MPRLQSTSWCAFPSAVRRRGVAPQFVEDPQWKPKDKNEQSLVDLLLLEKIPLAGTARATGVSESWLQGYVNVCYEWVPKSAVVMPKAKGKLTVQMDELWSFVDNKGNKQWVWLAIDADTREVIGCYIGGKRSHAVGLSLKSIGSVVVAIDSCCV